MSIKEKIKLDNFINLPKIMKLNGYLLKLTGITSTDLDGFYNKELHIIRYIICITHFFLVSLGLLIGLFIDINDSLFHSIDNEFLPKNSRILSAVALIIIFLPISVRFDYLNYEWHHHMECYKVFYFMQKDEKEKVGLTEKNYKKFLILAKLIEVTLQLGIIFMSFVVTLFYCISQSDQTNYY